MNLPFGNTASSGHRSCDGSGRQRLYVLSAVLAPTFLAVGWGVAFPEPGPTTAYADTTADPDPNASLAGSVRARTPTEEEIAATAYCLELCAEREPISSPTLIPPIDSPADTPVATPDAPKADPGKPNIDIASLLRDARGRPAVYADGTLYIEGDRLAGGWIVDTIDLPTRTVTLRHPDREQPVTLTPGR